MIQTLELSCGATVSQRRAAAILGVHASLVPTMVKLGQLDAVAVGRRRRITRASIERLLRLSPQPQPPTVAREAAAVTA